VADRLPPRGAGYRPTPRQRADEHDHGPTAQLVEEVWCVTCEHAHIGTIPSTTFRCYGDERPCGFGCWGASVAAAHATNFPGHLVTPTVHVTVPLSWRSRVTVELFRGEDAVEVR
jgi:hypothetical protein